MDGTDQWLPYWSNGNIPLVGLIEAAGAEDKLDSELGLVAIVKEMMVYVLSHTNKTTG